jgi:hypothetical protein
MFFQKTMKKVLAERGYKHCAGDEGFSLHGEYARNLQYAFSKELTAPGSKVVDVIFLGANMRDEKIVIGFSRENLSVQNGVLENAEVSIPLSRFSIDEFEKQLDRLIPKKIPVHQPASEHHTF